MRPTDEPTNANRTASGGTCLIVEEEEEEEEKEEVPGGEESDLRDQHMGLTDEEGEIFKRPRSTNRLMVIEKVGSLLVWQGQSAVRWIGHGRRMNWKFWLIIDEGIRPSVRPSVRHVSDQTDD